MLKDELHEGLRQQLNRFASRERGGWKIGLTSGKMRDSMGVGFRPFGQIAKDRIFSSGSVISLQDISSIGVENELCFEFGNDLSMQPSRAEVIESVRAIAPAFELNEPRLPRNVVNAKKLADNLSQWGIVVGAAVSAWRDIEFDKLIVSLFRNGAWVETVKARDHIDNHLDSLVSLTRTLSQFGIHLREDDRVITGSFTRQPVMGPSIWRGDFGEEIGEVEVQWV